MPLKTVGSFSVQYLQVLDEHGNLDEELEPDLSPAELLRLYRVMTLAREADQRMLKLQRQGRVGTFGPSTGQEAAVCGATLAMRDEDWFVPAFRELGGKLMRGVALEQNLYTHNGYEEGNNPAGGLERTLPDAVIVASQIQHAVGIAYAMKVQKDPGCAVTFFGDGATSQGDFHEALNFAAVWKAPVVFFCQNNQWAISTPRAQQTASQTLAQKAIAYGMPGIQVDGNDALAVYRATREALERARAGGGPTLIEAVTYRLMMHTTADDPRKYRDEAEEQAAWTREPLKRFRIYLEQKGLWDPGKQTNLDAEIKAEIEASVQRFEARDDFPIEAPFDHIFGTTHPELEEQRAEFLARLEREGGYHG